eukprot:gene8218-9767_t
MAELGQIFSFGLLMISSWLAGSAVEKSGCPGLVGELLAGALLGPQTLGLISGTLSANLMLLGDGALMLLVCEGGISMDMQASARLYSAPTEA